MTQTAPETKLSFAEDHESDMHQKIAAQVEAEPHQVVPPALSVPQMPENLTHQFEKDENPQNSDQVDNQEKGDIIGEALQAVDGTVKDLVGLPRVKTADSKNFFAKKIENAQNRGQHLEK